MAAPGCRSLSDNATASPSQPSDNGCSWHQQFLEDQISGLSLYTSELPG
jgi:hypothetical protein